jgi:hypothetical protein
MSYEQGYEDGRNERRSIEATAQLGRGIGSLMMAGVVLAFSCTLIALVAAPFLLVGFLVLTPFDFLGSTTSSMRLTGVGITSFLSYAGLYWVKGLALGLRQAGRGKWWWLPFLFCVLTACVLPAWLFRAVFMHTFPAAGPSWGWGLGAGFFLLAYGRYRFTQPGAPGWVRWAYVRGYRLGDRVGSST